MWCQKLLNTFGVNFEFKNYEDTVRDYYEKYENFCQKRDVNRALRILKKKMLAEGVMKEARENEFLDQKARNVDLQQKQAKNVGRKTVTTGKSSSEERNQIRNNRKKKKSFNKAR